MTREITAKLKAWHPISWALLVASILLLGGVALAAIETAQDNPQRDRLLEQLNTKPTVGSLVILADGTIASIEEWLQDGSVKISYRWLHMGSPWREFSIERLAGKAKEVIPVGTEKWAETALAFIRQQG